METTDVKEVRDGGKGRDWGAQLGRKACTCDSNLKVRENKLMMEVPILNELWPYSCIVLC